MRAAKRGVKIKWEAEEIFLKRLEGMNKCIVTHSRLNINKNCNNITWQIYFRKREKIINNSKKAQFMRQILRRKNLRHAQPLLHLSRQLRKQNYFFYSNSNLIIHLTLKGKFR